MQREPDREVEDHADDGGGDRAERAGEALVAAQALDVGGADEDPEEAGRERDPGRKQSAERRCKHRRQPAGIAIGGHEANELKHHDQRAWAWSRPCRDRRASRAASASDNARPPAAQHRPAPHKRRRK